MALSDWIGFLNPFSVRPLPIFGGSEPSLLDRIFSLKTILAVGGLVIVAEYVGVIGEK